MNKVKIVTAVLAVAAAGSAAFGGAALAWGDESTGGAGTGGTATNNCVNVGIPLLSGLGVLGQGSATGATCNATANGTGGAAS